MKRFLAVAVFAFAMFACPSIKAQTVHGVLWGWSAVTTDTSGATITVDGYNAYCSTSATGPFTTKTNGALITTTSFLETGLQTGLTYYCQITAVKGALESAHSATSVGALFQFPPAAPGPPVGTLQ